ncbi:MAG: penicillin-binding protein 2 [Deltaproteobacteria bacterium]|jgi:cell division protein FtsI (penicillin-binding protein 3)|nr:penicillin-binding protein 2 [Deltaproteobacteria bacterium]
MRSQALDAASRRIALIRLCGLALALILAGRAAQLAVDNDRTRQLFRQQIATSQQLAPARGAIFDRDGRELAITIESASIYALPRLVQDRAATAARLAEVLDLDAGRLARRLAERDRFTYLARWVSGERAERLRALDLPGIGIDREPRRSYPAGKLAAPLIGFANIDGEGVRGVEQLENEWLKGKPRSVRVERDARGVALALHSTDPRAVQGGEIALTLDAAMQGAAEAALQEAVEAHGALGGAVITLDPRSGDVLALAEAPGFDPNRFREMDYAETRARSFTDVVEAGSTMKVFLIATALDSGRIDPWTELDTGEGWMRVKGKTIRDHHPYGLLNPGGVLEVSSNVGAVQIAQLLGRESQHRGLLRFGFGSASGSGFPMESAGLVRDWARWKPVDQATVAFGQGLSVTAIQLGGALAALANDGERMQPRIVLARRRNGEPWQHHEPRRLGRAVSQEAAHQTLDMMRRVVGPEGTGRLAGLRDVPVAGKTGTAQKLDAELGRYSQDRYIAWFMGVVPADDPELAIVVAVDEPRGTLHSGGGVAAPIFARVAAAQLARRGIVTEPQPIPPAPPKTLLVESDERPSRPTPEQREPVLAARRTHTQPPRAVQAAPPARPAAIPSVAAGPSLPAVVPARILDVDELPVAPAPRQSPPAGTLADPSFVPDFSGHTVDRALRLARRESLILSIRGARNGRVVSQIPVPGTLLDGDDRTVRLQLAATREEG